MGLNFFFIGILYKIFFSFFLKKKIEKDLRTYGDDDVSFEVVQN